MLSTHEFILSLHSSLQWYDSVMWFFKNIHICELCPFHTIRGISIIKLKREWIFTWNEVLEMWKIVILFTAKTVKQERCFDETNEKSGNDCKQFMD